MKKEKKIRINKTDKINPIYLEQYNKALADLEEYDKHFEHLVKDTNLSLEEYQSLSRERSFKLSKIEGLKTRAYKNVPAKYDFERYVGSYPGTEI